MKQENMSIWDRNKTIEQRFTKQATVGGMKITSFSLQSVVMMATKEFGPIGKGWGYEVTDERFDEGRIIQDAVTHENGDKQPQIKEITHTLIIKLWYMLDNEKVECPVQAGHTPYLSKTKYGPSHDNEYYKKTLADAIKKSLSMLGFGADIFLGLMDDQHYLQIQESERNLKEQSELPKRIEEFGAKVKGFAEMYKTTTMGHSIKAMYESHKAQIHSECRKLGIDPNKFLDKCTNAYQARVEELKSPKKQG